jgi:gliding motility-associated lipoprotein GldH
MIYLRYILFGLYLISLTSCDEKRVYEENIELEHFKWATNNVLRFEFNINDTTMPCNMYINIRNTSEYPYSNLFLFLDTKYPDGKVSRDTLECILADDLGNWFGKGTGDVIDNQIPFRKNTRFRQKGTYKFYVEQAMRVNPLQGVGAAGIRIEKSN